MPVPDAGQGAWKASPIRTRPSLDMAGDFIKVGATRLAAADDRGAGQRRAGRRRTNSVRAAIGSWLMRRVHGSVRAR